jgi:ribonuclease HI
MTPKPVARPRPEPAPAPPPPPFPTVAVKITNHEGIFFYYATDGVQSWSGSAAAPTRDAALVDIFSDIRSDIARPVRFAISVPPTNPIWQHINELQKALGCLVERAHLGDQSLMDEAGNRVRELLPVTNTLGFQTPPPVEQPAEKAMEPVVGEPLTVATDGSVRGSYTGYGWLANDGRFRLLGSMKPKGLQVQKAVLLTELRAIDDAVRSLPGHPLTVLTDSTIAASLISDWMAGCDFYPHGFPGAEADQHPLSYIRESIHANRERLSCRWVKAHRGDPLNEGADALARLASRYVRGDTDLVGNEYERRAAGIAESFSAEFGRLAEAG